MGVPAVVLCLLWAGSVLVSRGGGVGEKESASGNMLQIDKKREGLLDAMTERDDCYDRKCVYAGQCCPGTTCVSAEGDSGTCLPLYSDGVASSSNLCSKDSDCGGSTMCDGDGTCFTTDRTRRRKRGFSDECITSADCDVELNLCCQIMRRHRMAPKRLCYYFVDPKSCVGDVRGDLKEIKYIPNPYFKARLG